MALFILDMGSGNTCRNDKDTIHRMIHEVAELDFNRHDVVLKWQLFKDAPPNIPLDHGCFNYAVEIAERLALRTTASVFDLESLRFLMNFDVPFVKIANRPDLYHLAEFATVPLYVSTAQSGFNLKNAVMLACVSNYPATLEEYEARFTFNELAYVSDHTEGWHLYKKYRPFVIEKHFIHIRSNDNPDAGPFAVTAAELQDGFNA